MYMSVLSNFSFGAVGWIYVIGLFHLFVLVSRVSIGICFASVLQNLGSLCFRCWFPTWLNVPKFSQFLMIVSCSQACEFDFLHLLFSLLIDKYWWCLFGFLVVRLVCWWFLLMTIFWSRLLHDLTDCRFGSGFGVGWISCSLIQCFHCCC